GLLEKYLAAARKIGRLAIGDPTIKPGLQTYSLPYMVLLQDGRMNDELPFGSRGGTALKHTFPVDGEYVIKVTMQRGYLDNDPRGLATAEMVDIRLDGQRVALLPVGGPDIINTDPYGKGLQQRQQAPDANLRVSMHVPAGAHTIGVTFQERNWV